MIVCLRWALSSPGSTAGTGAGGTTIEKLARVSRRDGRVLWDVSLPDRYGGYSVADTAPNENSDLNGDGGPDLVLGPSRSGTAGQSVRQVLAISLRDGERLWTRSLGSDSRDFDGTRVTSGDGAARPSVIVMDGVDQGGQADLRVRAYDGASGELRWSSMPGAMRANRQSAAGIVMADFGGDRRTSPCVSFREPGGAGRIVVLGRLGEETARREFHGDTDHEPLAADINGDGKEELVGWWGGGAHAMDRDLKDIWTHTTAPSVTARYATLAGIAGRGSTVLTSPALWLDGATGRSKWAGQGEIVEGQFRSEMLDPGESTRPPVLITTGPSKTVCRLGVETTPEGKIAEAKGRVVKVRGGSDDPRWGRPLPWVSVLEGEFGPFGLLGAMELAVISVFVPVLIVRVARGRRRNYTIRALMSVPVAAAVPLVVYLTVVPRLPPSDSPLLATDGRMFVTGTLAGLPVVACLVWVGASVVLRRWWRLVGHLGLVIVATILVGGGWLWVDRKAMAANVEHYEWDGCGLVVMAGAYVAAVVWMVGVGVYWCVRSLNRSGIRE